MKIYSALLLIPFLHSCATYQVRPTNIKTDNFAVIRRGYNSAAVRMKVFVDDQLIGKVSGYRYLSFSLPAGSHEVYFKFSPLVSRSERRSFEIADGEKMVFIVRKGLLKYGVEIMEGRSLPVGMEKKRSPKVRK